MSRMSDIVEPLAARLGITKGAARAAVNGVQAVMADEIVATGELIIQGVGRIYTVEKPAETRKILGKEYDLPDRKTVRFKPAPKLKERFADQAAEAAAAKGKKKKK